MLGGTGISWISDKVFEDQRCGNEKWWVSIGGGSLVGVGT